MSTTYTDRWMHCTPDAVHLRAYYFPWGGDKRIAYDSIRSVRRVAIGALTGRGRLWGTSNPRYWAGLDFQRPRKKTALILDVGASVKPFVTPDDPDAAEAVIREHANLAPSPDRGTRGPIM